MRRGLLFFVLLMSVRFEATGQTPPTLQIAETNGAAALSWSLNSFPIFILQGTTNLSPPITWTNLAAAYGTGSANVPMTNSQQFFRLAELIPIFQFAVFYNLNLEIQPGSSVNFGGPVFCNASIWAASPLTFSNSVAAVGTISSNNISDPFMTPGAKTGSGNPTFLIPPIAGAGALNFPTLGTNNNPTNFEAILQMPPNGVDPYSPTGQAYFYNDTDLIISNSVSGTNVMAFFQDANNSIRLTPIPYDSQMISEILETNYSMDYQTNITITGKPPHYMTNIVTVTITNVAVEAEITNYGYSFVTSTNFYDYRESKTVSAIYLNVTNLDFWLTNTAPLGGSQYNNQTMLDTGKGINSIYIYNSVKMTSSTLPGVQVVNGAQLLPYGLAIATPDPIYIEGNFNSQTSAGNDAGTSDVTYIYPAALYADAITVLSANWNDNYASSTSLSSRTPVSTTVNAAVFEGIVPSSGAHYSGGLENFLRLQEDWTSSTTLTYNGSIVVMFPSQYATNFWNGNVYGVPRRQWNFDANFTQEGGLPPLTPWVLNLVSP